MNGPTLHVYHEQAATIRERMRAAGVANEIVAWSDPAAFRAGIGHVEILVTESPPAGEWANARRLRWIQTLGAGVDGLLPAPDLAENVVITSARGVFAAEVAEHAVMCLLALQRNLPAHVENRVRRAWRPFASGSLAGRSAGVLGLGEIGRRVAALCSALGMRVRGVRRSPRPMEGVEEVVGADELERVLRASEHLIVTLPLTAETKGLLGREALSLLPARAFLIHVGRGGVVDESALLDALSTGHLGGAAIDVFEQEPLPPDSPFWTAPNTIVTPHVAGSGLRYVERVAELVLANLARLERGEPLAPQVDRRAGY